MTQIRFRAITTRYKGYAFRSRLEARWAVFFDHLNIRWEYEPEGFELGNGLRYLPDFWLPDWRLWVEVKPGPPDDVTREKAWRLASYSGSAVLTTSGMPDSVASLFVTHTQLGGEVGLYEFPVIVNWGYPCLLLVDDGMPGQTDEFDQLPHVPMLARLPRQKVQAALQLAAGGVRAALEAARGARFEFGEKGGL